MTKEDYNKIKKPLEDKLKELYEELFQDYVKSNGYLKDEAKIGLGYLVMYLPSEGRYETDEEYDERVASKIHIPINLPELVYGENTFDELIMYTHAGIGPHFRYELNFEEDIYKISIYDEYKDQATTKSFLNIWISSLDKMLDEFQLGKYLDN